MTHFVDRGEKTAKPESLTALQKTKVLFCGVRVPKPRNSDNPANRGMPFSTHRFVGSSSIDYEAWHIPCADSRGLCVLFHGYANCKSSLLPEAQAFRELGYETFLVDFRGCGGSGGRVTTIGFHEADDVAVAVEYVRRELTEEPPILFGRSMGAVAILRAVSSSGLKPRAVIIECPFDRLLSTTKNRFSTMGIPSFPCAQLLVFWGGVQHGFSGFRHNSVEYASQVHCPVLLLNGEQDPRVTKEQATAVIKNLRGEKQLVLFEGVGHVPCLTGDPKQWNRAVTEFLSQH